MERVPPIGLACLQSGKDYLRTADIDGSNDFSFERAVMVSVRQF
jgi:hypothetical protein